MTEPLFEFYRGDDHYLNIKITDDSELSTPVDVTGWYFKASMSLNPYPKTEEYVQLAVDIGPLSGAEAEAGNVTIHLPHEKTQSLLPAMYFFDVQCEVEGTVKTLFTGKVKVKPDVTRRVG